MRNLTLKRDKNNQHWRNTQHWRFQFFNFANFALGLDKVNGTKGQVGTLFTGNLEDGGCSRIVALHCVKGADKKTPLPISTKEERKDEVCL